MKRFFRFVMAAAVIFSAVSCAKEDISSSIGGGEVEVTFTANLADLGTRAIGDGTKADVVYLAIYEAGTNDPLSKEIIDPTNPIPVVGKAASISVVLLKDKKYDLVFWAQNSDVNCYNRDLANRTMTIDYKNAKSQVEKSDAFFLVCNNWKAGEGKTTFELRRPFAQLNVGLSADEVKRVQNNGVVVENIYSAVTVKGLANVLDLGFDDEKAGTVSASEGFDGVVTYKSAAKPKVALEVSGVKYEYLSMNYLLVNGKQNVDVTYTFEEQDAEDTDYIRPYYNVPVQRNYRTNIVGNLLSSEYEFNVIIVPEFYEPDEVYEDYHVQKDANGNDTAFVNSANGLLTVAEEIANGTISSEANIVLDNNIDLNATRSAVSNWTPIGTSQQPFTGTFDGKGYTIKNLALVENEAKEGKAYIGFFGYTKDATIKNVTFENVYINIPCLDIDHSQGHIGAVAGSLEGTSTIENVTVKGDIQVYATQDANGASRVAVVAGGNSYGNVTMKNVHVIANEGSSLIANNNTGALAGQLQGKSVFENCSSNIDVTVNKFFAGGIIGLAAGDQLFVNCHTTGDVAVVAGREGRAHDQYRVGGIAGGWADGATKVCTLVNCSYTGNVSGKNSDGSVANPLDYFGYVGRGYTLNGCAGSKVVIDGVEFVQVGNTAAQAGIYTINGCTPVSTADELVAALEANEGVYLLNDIKIEPAAMSNAYGKTGINVKNGQTIDGGGHTLNIQGAGGTWDSGINTTGGLIKDITVTGSFRGIFINHTSTHSEKVVLENVTITGTVYTISCDQGLYQGIEATNCTFNGWTSFAKTAGEAKFVNCLFGEGNGYKYCRPYSKTEFVNCTFCPGYTVDQSQAEVTFTNCTWNE